MPAIVVDAKSGQVLQNYNGDAPHVPASLTKMMTLYLAFEALEQGRIKLDTPVAISGHAASRAPTKMYFQAGQQVTVENLIQAMVVKSANDAAVAMAEHLAASEAEFAARMTEKARDIGMTRTVFQNASGLPAAGQITTARDMAILSRALIYRFPQYYDYFGRRHFTYGNRTYSNTNRLLHTNGTVDGVKTGYTRGSGFNVSIAAENNGQRVIVVVLGGRTSSARYRRVEQLLTGAWRDAPASRTVAAASERTPVAVDRPAEREGFSLIGRATAATKRVAIAFGVQLGTYRSYSQAHRVAQAAFGKVPLAYRQGTKVSIAAMRSRGKTQYAARLVGFAQADNAEQTCRLLVRNGHRCQTVSYALEHATSTDTAADAPESAPEIEREVKRFSQESTAMEAPGAIGLGR